MPKSLKKTNHKYFWEQTYEGKEVLGFMSPTVDYSSSGSTFYIEESIAFSYCLKGDNVAVTYFVPESGSRAWPKKNTSHVF